MHFGEVIKKREYRISTKLCSESNTVMYHLN
jgi:hypothetical protein